MIFGDDPTSVPLAPDDLPVNPMDSYRPESIDRGAQPAFDPTMFLGIPTGDLTQGSETAPLDAQTGSRSRDRSANAYILRREVGAGTFGEIWEAVQVTLKRVVAVKRPKAHSSDADPVESRRSELEFVKEALTAGQLDHPNVVPVYDLGADEQGRPLLAMKLVEGTRWDELILGEERTGRDYWVRHISILVKVSKAVAFAHSRGILHRDLKPQQVMVGHFGEVFLMDWGLAVGLPDSESLRLSGGFVTPVAEATNPAGTPAYMAPEQTHATPKQIGAWTDIYLLGGTLYYVLTGRPPHGGETAWEAFGAAARGVVEAPESAAPQNEVPPELSAICIHALAAQPEMRPQSTREFVEALEGWLAGTASREESRAATAQAAALLDSPSATSYATLEESDALLVQALLLWPENPEASDLQRRMLESYTEQALAQGDLTLAAAQAERLPDEQQRAPLLQRVVTAMRKAEANKRQLRLAVYGAFALLIAVTFLGLLNARMAAEAMVRESRHIKVLAELDMARKEEERKRREEELNAALFQRLSDVRVAVAELVDIATREVLTPTSLYKKEDLSAVWLTSRPGVAEHLRAKLLNLDQQRQTLLADGEWVEPDPPEISFARGVLALADGGTTGPVEAYTHFAQTAHVLPSRHEPRLALGIAAARRDALTSAAVHFQEAIQRAGFADSAMSNQRAVSMHKEANQRLWKNGAVGPEDLLIESWPGAQNPALYQEISSYWDSENTSNYKSVAPGLTPQETCGTRRVLFYEPFRPVNVVLPAQARFLPSLQEPRRFHVYVTWPGSANASPVYYRVRHQAGEDIIPLAQNGFGVGDEPNSNAWIALGEFEFGTGPDQYVEVAIGDDVRPIASERYGQVSTDAVLFAATPLSTGVRPAEPVQDANPSGPVVSSASEDTDRSVHWYTSIAEAREAAISLRKPLFLYSSYPVDSCFIHPLNRNRDYCENRLLRHPSILEVLQEKYVAGKIDLSNNPAAAKEWGGLPAEASLSVMDLSSSNPLQLQLTGKELLISPAELAKSLAGLNEFP